MPDHGQLGTRRGKWQLLDNQWTDSSKTVGRSAWQDSQPIEPYQHQDDRQKGHVHDDFARQTKIVESVVHKTSVIIARGHDDVRNPSQMLQGEFAQRCDRMLPIEQCYIIVIGDPHALESLAAVYQPCERSEEHTSELQ